MNSVRARPFGLMAGLVILCACVPVITGTAAPAQLAPVVEVFTDQQRSASGQATLADAGVTVVVYTLDAPSPLEAELSAGLPVNPDQAMAMARERINAFSAETLRQRINAEQVGPRRLLQLGIDRYPAIVINSRTVLYGTTDLAAAWARYQAWLGSDR